MQNKYIWDGPRHWGITPTKLVLKAIKQVQLVFSSVLMPPSSTGWWKTPSGTNVKLLVPVGVSTRYQKIFHELVQKKNISLKYNICIGEIVRKVCARQEVPFESRPTHTHIFCVKIACLIYVSCLVLISETFGRVPFWRDNRNRLVSLQQKPQGNGQKTLGKSFPYRIQWGKTGRDKFNGKQVLPTVLTDNLGKVFLGNMGTQQTCLEKKSITLHLLT